jgi:NADH-quinone oxidoreductase subunit G
MGKMITLTIDGQSVTVPEGTLVVNAAKKIGIEIPVFCYHPKMEPVGMCRMCLVDIGRPVIDRSTGQPVFEADGSPKIGFGPKLETACTTPVSAGMVVVGMSDKVKAARKDVLEFLLTSHPLDCPVCDKGGECPLQNLTLHFGPGQSRFLYDEKMHSRKHVPLGDLILLDRERCIQCARCVRFQDNVVDDPVIGFYNRGRALEIVTYSDPGFDSYFSGNTTDICPVGALTTVDFHFGARPWELQTAASVCTHCPVGCNLAVNVRREAHSDGRVVIKRVLPRQNEAVNEIWICDKGRFGYHYTESPQRLTQPLVRDVRGELVPAAWDAALDLVAQKIRAAGSRLVTLAGGRLSNEDLFNLQQLTSAQGGKAVLDSLMAGGDLVTQLGLGRATNFKDLGRGSAILVAACDLEEEAPIWWLRVKQAAERGAVVITLNPRQTKLDRVASHSLRYAYGEEGAAFEKLLAGDSEASQALTAAENLVVMVGSEGMALAASQQVMSLAAKLLVQSGYAGKDGSGLVGVWQHANDQGAWDLGFRPADDLPQVIANAGVLLVAAADPAGDSPHLAQAVDAAEFVVAQELFLTETARRADVVLPVQAFTEREGTFTSGERRVQRYYPAVPPLSDTRPDYAVTAAIASRLDLPLEGHSAALVFLHLADQVGDYAGLTYQRLAEVIPQEPLIGRADLYYGGTGYDNQQGLGVHLAPSFQMGIPVHLSEIVAAPPLPETDLLAVPFTQLYDRGTTLVPSKLLENRLAQPVVWLHPADADRLGMEVGEMVEITLNGVTASARVALDETQPTGVVRVARSLGLPVHGPAPLICSAPLRKR